MVWFSLPAKRRPGCGDAGRGSHLGRKQETGGYCAPKSQNNSGLSQSGPSARSSSIRSRGAPLGFEHHQGQTPQPF